MAMMGKSLKGIGVQTFAKSYLDIDYPELKKETKRNTRGNRSMHSPATIVHIRRNESNLSLLSTSSSPPEIVDGLAARLEAQSTSVPRRTYSEGARPYGSPDVSPPCGAAVVNMLTATPSHEHGFEIGGKVRKGSVYKKAAARKSPLEGLKGGDGELRKTVSFSSFATVVGSHALPEGSVEHVGLKLCAGKSLKK